MLVRGSGRGFAGWQLAGVDAGVENETIRGLPPRRVCADG